MKHRVSRFWIAAVVVLCAALLLTGVFLFRQRHVQTIFLAGIPRTYKNLQFMGEPDIGVVWPWEYMTLAEQYPTLLLGEHPFRSRGRTVDGSLLGEVIGDYELIGTDPYTEKVHRMTTEVRSITGVSADKLVAVWLGNVYYVFLNDAYSPPADLGSMLDDYGLCQTLTLDRFTVYDGHTDQGTYQLETDLPIWDVLTTCRSAPFILDEAWSSGDWKYLSFTATSEALGAYKHVFYVTEDGYVRTNLFDYAFCYEIGTDAAAQIISYARNTGTETAPEPYDPNPSVIGTIVAIRPDGILIDDAFRCVRPGEGMTFRIPMDDLDLRILRRIEQRQVSVGDIVSVRFTGGIDTGKHNTIHGAYQLSKLTLWEGT